ncbi:uncharacterized protein BDZ99DRAFT_546125 [Mytilinidion resinicola]|uniref:RING-type domain-containing protein n=1 Tax=Mytilinidion resinicola TaxID=574789 RepID=A0A6A6Y4X7_9PEZI|nr:uncharacterized protein BDZ99DRAFT_546125 [Mytilinidion resinicola]KAF2803679.1 hypothetical protein BDZ99DRAFT_546125 [Mytilinidion resinicola]
MVADSNGCLAGLAHKTAWGAALRQVSWHPSIDMSPKFAIPGCRAQPRSDDSAPPSADLDAFPQQYGTQPRSLPHGSPPVACPGQTPSCPAALADFMEEQQAEPLVCLSCQNGEVELFFCNVCELTLCGTCWDQQLVHRINASAHEKTRPDLERRIQRVFAHPSNESDYERMHEDDEGSAWFGIGYSELSDDIILRDYGEYAQLINQIGMDSRRWGIRQRRLRSKNNLPMQSRVDLSSCHPGLVSFVGVSGAGKSTLIKLLILTTTLEETKFPTPIPGAPGKHIPTSDGIHLYADPQTVLSSQPILYADCEGLDGGTIDPQAARYDRRRLYGNDAAPLSPGTTDGFPFCVQRRLAWALDDTRRSRSFAVSQLYPRILFAFSDVVVFVHQNPRTIEDVLEKLISWAAKAETSSNQPVLPYLILVLNGCEEGLEQFYWDVDAATNSLFESLAGTVATNPVFKTYAKSWRTRGKQITSLEDLILCYYSRLRMVRIPANSRPTLIHDQALKLHEEIQRGVALVQERKSRLRLLLNAVDFQTFFQHALDHFCTTLEKPFDFVRASFWNSRLSSDFSESILAIAITMRDATKTPNAVSIFGRLSNLIASCIMLDAVRNDIRGSADRLLPKYAARIEDALSEFCDRHWPCEYVYIDPWDTEDLGSGWDNSVMFTVASKNFKRLHCVNVKVAHGDRGHQLADGTYFAAGEHFSRFSVESHKTVILDKIYFVLHHLLDSLSKCGQPGESQPATAHRLHRDEVLRPFYESIERTNAGTRFQSTKFCPSCLFEQVYQVLPCGHAFCRHCIQAYGWWQSKTILEVSQCPLTDRCRFPDRGYTTYIKPEDAGLRILALDEQLAKGEDPVVPFPRPTLTNPRTGGVLALGLATKAWTAQDCEKHLLVLLHEILAKAKAEGRRWPVKLQVRPKRQETSMYSAKKLEESLKHLFTPTQAMVDNPSDSTTQPSDAVRVAIRSRTIGEQAAIFSNYLSRTTHTDVKAWECARATMAIRPLFKPFVCKELGPLSLNVKRDSEAITIAAQELDSAFGGSDQQIMDVILSLGCTDRHDRNPSLALSEFMEGTNWRSLLERNKTNSLGATPFRFAIRLDKPPAFDDLSAISKLRDEAMFQIDSTEVRSMAARLFACLFYVETDNTAHAISRSKFVVQAHLLCRLSDGTNEMPQLGKLLHFSGGTFSGLRFIFREEGYDAQVFAIPHESLVIDLIHSSRFTAPKFPVQLSTRSAVVNGTICLRNGEEFPLSGFPKQLLREKRPSSSRFTSASGSGSSSTPTPGQLSMGVWTAPSLIDIPSPSELSLSSLEQAMEEAWYLRDTNSSQSPSIRGTSVGGTSSPLSLSRA